ncbi:hypothetical protein CcCBS67573_g09561 [Chytriomyces confervae]|uniref:non-specific serine/threonine protein kinase n=1 Tax=Chytriomyces confervae TaxID=246404 RepID=A0A507DUM6_9FUNG|nr:hypothetical protein CcCBS67573_g09561 [Chytriomyces confervae]
MEAGQIETNAKTDLKRKMSMEGGTSVRGGSVSGSGSCSGSGSGSESEFDGGKEKVAVVDAADGQEEGEVVEPVHQDAPSTSRRDKEARHGERRRRKRHRDREGGDDDGEKRHSKSKRRERNKDGERHCEREEDPARPPAAPYIQASHNHNNNLNPSNLASISNGSSKFNMVSASIIASQRAYNLNSSSADHGASLLHIASNNSLQSGNIGSDKLIDDKKEDSKETAGISEDAVAIGGEVDDEERLIEERRKRLLAIMQKHNSHSEVSAGNPFSTTASVASPVISEGTGLAHAESAHSESSPNANNSNTLQNTSQMDLDAENALAKILEQDQSDIASNLLTLENSNSKPAMPADATLAAENEISAADYDPNQDGANDDQHRHHIIGKGAEKDGAKHIAIVRDDDDMFNPSAVTAPIVPAKKKGKKKAAAEVEFDMFADDDMFAVGGDAKPAKVTTHILDSAAVVRSSDNPALIDNWDDHEGYYSELSSPNSFVFPCLIKSNVGIILGEVLDNRYHVYQNLGRGVFSGVVKARDTKNGDVDVAIKVIRNNDTMFRAGMKEIGILKKLQELDPDDKKHTIRLIRHFEHKNHLCMVFESMSMNLREVLKKFGKDIGLNIKAVRVYAQQLFLSLSLLRKANVLHADIKPDNVLVNDSKNVLKLCDLGSASDASENEITPYLVSRFYRAPEIILGLPYDFAMDMWSIGCTLYELYTGKILFPGRSNNQMLRYMQETKGAFPKKMVRKGQFSHQHFDENMSFLQIDVDKVSGNSIVKPLSITAPIKDLKTRLAGGAIGASKEEAKMIASFIDLLDKLLHLAPDKRIGVKEALVHPFITGQ